ncbi:hypothetical protein H8Z72_23270 (plasmid) [Xanthomonas citri pv. citri]|uniref:hypothetical protein n=1 Tax=Xanthomonas citri TaxID=346 RepID=UPI001931CA38|nr:hypothetical protein [Xanthomonas citri]QRD62765.1 hypothetical protein H8Z74_22915 [Xanthomonas citri pv. citri]QRD67092.1 hypothetical protein H8Z73_23000 [Xanthomonas citri pv. citri]QRD71655.1 hypothetical protein H8Z72_23270 [Xanthomonas citri pv. citri]
MSLKQKYRGRLKHPLVRQRLSKRPAVPRLDTPPTDTSHVPASVVVDLQRLDESVDALDAIYQDVLTAIERQARDAITLNHDLTVLFTNGQTSSATQVLDWSAERAMAPFDAFRQLAERLMDELRPVLDPSGRLSAVPYHDLIEWPDLPSHGTPNERLLATIAYARQRQLKVFLEEVKARFQPEKIPENAAQLAAGDMIAGFCVDQPDMVLLPVKLHSGAACLTLRLLKSPLSMHINKANLNIILRVNAAIATIARLSGKHKQATILNEGSNAMLLRLSGQQFQFADGDRHHFADELIVLMRPDHLQYHMPQTLYDLIASAIRTYAPSIIILPR